MNKKPFLKGITWDKKSESWRVQIYVEGKNVYLGKFRTAMSALEAYDKAAVKHHGKSAELNYP